MCVSEYVTRLAKRSTAGPVSLGFVLLFGQAVGYAQTPEALPFSKSYLVTGNYVVGSVDLAPQSGANGFITGTIPMSGVPANADILAAFLYWETISTQNDQVNGVRFRDQAVTAVSSRSKLLDGNTAQCWSSGGGSGASYMMTMFRADVLRLLPAEYEDGRPTGRRLVNGLHTVTLPEAGTGNQVPSSAGATLVVVYRDPDPTAQLTSVVIYDGIAVQAPGETTSRTIRGFYQSADSPAAKITHIVGSGAPNYTDRLWVNDNLIGQDVFWASASPSSDRAWSSPTVELTEQMLGTDPGYGYGEEVTTRVDHGSSSPYDCLAWAAIVMSTTVQDTDGDGLQDNLETGAVTTHPSGQDLPNLRGMVSSNR